MKPALRCAFSMLAAVSWGTLWGLIARVVRSGISITYLLWPQTILCICWIEVEGCLMVGTIKARHVALHHWTYLGCGVRKRMVTYRYIMHKYKLCWCCTAALGPSQAFIDLKIG